MREIAVGRQAIMTALAVQSWRTIQLWKKNDAGFRTILHEHPINKKPFIVISEAIRWMIEYDKIKKSEHIG